MFNLASFLKDGFLMIIFKCFHYIQFIKKDKGTKHITKKHCNTKLLSILNDDIYFWNKYH